MKHKCSLELAGAAILILISWSGHSLAQTPPQAGFVLVNATGLNEKAKLSADGKNLLGEGLESGGATSGIPLTIGTHQVQVTVPPLPPVNAPLAITAGTSPVLVAHLEEVPDPQSRTTKKVLRLTPLPQRPQTSKYLTSLVSFVPTPLAVQVNHQPLALEYKKPSTVEGRHLLVAEDGKEILDTEFAEKSSQFCILFKAEKTVQAVLVPDMVYTW